MQHHAAFHQGLHCLKKVNKDPQTKEYNFFLEKYDLTPLDMYNGLSQVYCIKLEGRVH